MADPLVKQVLRSRSPQRQPQARRVLRAVGVALALAALYASFEAGRRDAGYRVLDSTRGALAANARIASLEAQNEQQRAQLEAADVARRVDREGYKQVERSLGDMQSQIARLNQDLSFYRGLVQPDSLVHVKIQQMQIVPQATPQQFRLKFVVIQSGKPEKNVSGSAAIAVDGLLRGRPVTLNFGQLSDGRRNGITYSFRYFQEYDEAIHLPPGFSPTRISVEIFSPRGGIHGFRQAFVWKAQGVSLEAEVGGHEDGNVQVD